MLKLAGAVLLVLGGWGLGATLVSAERRRVREGEALLDFIRFIRAQIDCFCRPRGELFALYRNDALSACGFLPALRQTGSIALAMEQGHLSVGGEIRAYLAAFDRELGKSYREEQLAACDYYAGRLSERLAEQRAALPARAKVRRTVCLSGALLISLLLL